jgi:two-component system, OmpR family, phosphate regulon sensor histidine kinase PhoR
VKLIWKISAGYGVLAMFTTALVGVLVARWIEQVTLEEIERTLGNYALILHDSVSGQLDAPDLQERVQALGQRIGARLTVIDDAGEVRADSEREPDGLPSHADRPELLAAELVGLGTSTRYSETLQTRMMYLALPLSGPGGEHQGFVRVALPLREVDRRLAEVRGFVVLGALVGLLISLVPVILFARHLTEPITRMTLAAQAVAEGDYTLAPRVTTRDELGELSLALTRMTEQLRERLETITSDRNKLMVILASMVEGLVAVDRDERVMHINGVAGAMLGIVPERALGKNVWEALRIREVCDALCRTLADPDSGAGGGEMLLAGRGAASSTRTLELRPAPLRHGEGTLVGALVVLHDVTELRRLERVRRDFVANVSHELKTPLTAIQGLTEILVDDAALEPKQRQHFLSRIQAQSHRLSALVTDLLVLSRIESGSEALERQPMDLRDPCRASAQGLQDAVSERSLTFEVDLGDQPAPVLGDEEALRQVIDNLLSNACRYTPEGGSVFLRVRIEGEEACLEVEDTGLGITPQDRERIFERFYRVDKARSRAVGGTGLGLAIVKHMVLAHHGRVEVHSLPGEGSTFRVLLPILQDDG